MASSYTLKSGSYDGRYLQLDLTQTKEIANNRSKITWKLSSVGGASNYYSTGPTAVVIAGTEVYSKGRVNWDSKVFPAAKGSVSGTIYADHDTKGNKSISVSLTTAIYVGAASTYSGTWQLDNIPRQAKITSANNFTDEENPSISFDNPGGFPMDVWLEPNPVGDHLCTRKNIPNKGSYTWDLTASEREELRNKCVGQKCTIRVGLYSNVGGTTYADFKDKTFYMTENEATKPTVSMSTTLNNGSLPSKFDGMYIQSKSRLNVSISAQGKYSASILSYSANIGGETYNSGSFLSNVLNKDGKVDVIGYAKDSRQFTGSDKQQIEVIPYSKPLVIPIGSETAIQCYRSDGNGKRTGNSTSVWIKAKRFYYSLSGKNQCALQWRKKLINETWNDNTHKWTELIAKTSTATNEYNALLSGVVFDLTKSYSVQIKATDDIGEYDLKTFEIPTQDVALHLGKGGKNVSVGTYCDYSKEYTFYSDWDAYFNKDIYVKDNKIAAFVIEQDISDDWIYEKWSNGIAKCYGRIRKDSTDTIYNSTAGDANVAYTTLAKDFPESLFKSKPFIFVAAIDSGNGNVTAADYGSTSARCNITVWGTNTAIGDVNVMAVGIWK